MNKEAEVGRAAGDSARGVTVVVPVYNPGPYLGRCLDSLLAQTLPRSRYEIMFVDDGSTDGAGARLDRAAAEHPDVVRVTHIPNSGWPGRPRNLGTELASYDYVFYCDADDWMPPNSLAAMLDRAETDNSDMVLARAIGNRRGVPRALFERGDYCTDWRQTPGVFSTLTTQKMFRREFLRERGLRFREGKVRLEDFIFMTQAYLQADRISILGTTPCYVFELRDDKGNLTATAAQEADYFSSVEKIIDVVVANTAPGAERDTALNRVLSAELLGTVTKPGFLGKDDDVRAEAFGYVRRLLTDRIPPSAVSRLDPFVQRRAAAIRAGDRALIEHWIRWESTVSADLELTGVSWESGRLRLDVRLALMAGGEAIRLERAGDRSFLSLPPVEGTPADPANRIDVTQDLARTSVYFTLRSRDISEDWRVRAEVSLQPDESQSGTVAMRWAATTFVDFSTVAGGATLRSGAWDLYVRITSCGWLRDRRVGSVRSPGVQALYPATVGGTVVRPVWTRLGNLSFEVKPDHGAPARREDVRAGARRGPPRSSGSITVEMNQAPSTKKVTWQRRAVRLARVLGLTATDVRPGAVLLSRSASWEVKELLRNQTYLVSRSRKAQPGLLRLGRGVSVITDGTDASGLAHERLDEHVWVVTADQAAGSGVEAAKVGTRGWLISRRDASPMADLNLENQTMQHLGVRHVAWLLKRYDVDCVLDVGANEGQYALGLRRNGYTGRIVSFEPVPQFVDALTKLSADDEQWTVRQLALGSTEGTVPIRVQRTFSSLLTSSDYGKRRFATLRNAAENEQVVDVPLRRLDMILDELLAPVVRADAGPPRVFLKMDTQGFDLEVFRGLGDRVREVVGLQSEVALLLIYEQMPRMPEAVAMYEAAGYEISGLYPITREPDGRVIEYDCVMVRASDLPG